MVVIPGLQACAEGDLMCCYEQSSTRVFPMAEVSSPSFLRRSDITDHFGYRLLLHCFTNPMTHRTYAHETENFPDGLCLNLIVLRLKNDHCVRLTFILIM